LEFKGKGNDEVGICTKTGKTLVRIDSRYMRPAEVDLLVGDASKAKRLLGWEAKVGLDELCKEMVEADYARAREEIAITKRGYHPPEEMIAKEGFLNWHTKNIIKDRAG